MTFLNLDILSISMGNGFYLDDEELQNRRSISFEVLPSEEGCLELETGEIFKNPRYIRNDDKPRISGYLSVYESSDDKTLKDHTHMIYRGELISEHDPENNHDSSLVFHVSLGKTFFSQLLKNLQSGIFPTSMFLTLVEKPFLEYGWEPDGSRKIWNNQDKDNRLFLNFPDR